MHKYSYEPGLSGNLSHLITSSEGALDTMVELSGTLAQFVKAYPTEVTADGMRGYLTYEIELPDDPGDFVGTHYAIFTVTENPKRRGSGVSARAAVVARFRVEFPYPGYYAVLGLSVPSVNEGEEIYAGVNIDNLGRENITDGKLTLIMQDYSQDVVFENRYNGISIGVGGAETIEEWVPSEGLPPGEYRAFAVLEYAGKTTQQDTRFNIGTYDIEIYNHTTSITSGKINRFDIDIKNLWKGKLENIYAVVDIGDRSFTSATAEADEFGKLKLAAYIDAESMEPGVYEAKITVYFMEISREREISVEVTGAPPDGDEEAAEEEMPSESKGLYIPVNATTVLALLVAALLAANAYILLGRKGEKGRKK